jgi:excisionase family DNA binding protein
MTPCETGKLPCIRVGRHIRFTRAMLEEWLKQM